MSVIKTSRLKKRSGKVLLAVLLLLLPGCRKPAPENRQETFKGEAARFEDGAEVSLWEDAFGREHYRLSDGTEILTVPHPVWPWNASVGSLEGFEGMSPAARQAVRTYFEEQGLLYNQSSLLDAAYQDYRQCRAVGKESSFQAHAAWQEVLPTNETERFTAFCTAVTRPLNAHFDGTVTESRASAYFDRETGEKYDAWELFSVPAETVGRELFARGALSDFLSEKEFIEALRPEYLCWYSTTLEICFPPEALEEFRDGWIAGIDLADLEDILQPWARL